MRRIVRYGGGGGAGGGGTPVGRTRRMLGREMEGPTGRGSLRRRHGSGGGTRSTTGTGAAAIIVIIVLVVVVVRSGRGRIPTTIGRVTPTARRVGGMGRRPHRRHRPLGGRRMGGRRCHQCCCRRRGCGGGSASTRMSTTTTRATTTRHRIRIVRTTRRRWMIRRTPCGVTAIPVAVGGGGGREESRRRAIAAALLRSRLLSTSVRRRTGPLSSHHTRRRPRARRIRRGVTTERTRWWMVVAWRGGNARNVVTSVSPFVLSTCSSRPPCRRRRWRRKFFRYLSVAKLREGGVEHIMALLVILLVLPQCLNKSGLKQMLVITIDQLTALRERRIHQIYRFIAEVFYDVFFFTVRRSSSGGGSAFLSALCRRRGRGGTICVVGVRIATSCGSRHWCIWLWWVARS